MTTRDQIAATVAGSMAAIAIETDWIAHRAYDIADALLKARGPEASKPDKPKPDKPKPDKSARKYKYEALLERMQEKGGEATCAQLGGNYTYTLTVLKNLQKKGLVSVDKSKRPHTYQVIQPDKPEASGKPGKVKPGAVEEHDPRIDFAKDLGYPTIAAALDAIGSWEFEKKFKTRQT